MSTQKLCVFCINFELSCGYADTFSEGMGHLECIRGHFDLSKFMATPDDSDLRSIIHTAESCPDWRPVNE